MSLSAVSPERCELALRLEPGRAASCPGSTNREMVLLEDQDRALWDPRLIALGFSHLGESADGDAMTAYHVQAAIAAVHAGAPTPEATRWDVILRLYDDLLAINPSPLVALNRAVALAKVSGAAAGLDALAAIEDEPPLRNYYLLPSVKGRLLAEVGDRAGAAAAFKAALAQPCSEPERRLIARRLRDIGA